MATAFSKKGRYICKVIQINMFVFYYIALIFFKYDSREKVAYTHITPDWVTLKILCCALEIIL